MDAAYAQVARTMLASGDWVTATLNGVPYFDKPPGQTWAMAMSFTVFGVSDWAARLPLAFGTVALCLLAWRTGRWAFGGMAGLYAGLGLASCYGLFLFTRVRMPDVFVACSSLVVLDCFLRSLEGAERQSRRRMLLAGSALGAGILCKGLVAIVLPVGAIACWMLASGTWRSASVWHRLNPLGFVGAAVLLAAPWHVLSTLRHPPWFDLTLETGPGQYRGFFWRYFMSEHVLRYLGLRYPKDYGRVALLWFCAGHLVWLFPWSPMLVTVNRLGFGSEERAGRARMLMLCFCLVCLGFFSLSTRQEYYTVPLYGPAMLLLASAAVALPGRMRTACRFAGSVCGLAALGAIAILVAVWQIPIDGDIFSSLEQEPDAYTLSLGHFQDLTLQTFAHLRGPLSVAAVAFTIAALGGLLLPCRRAAASLAIGSLALVHSAHWAMAGFDPYLSSRFMADAYARNPPGRIVLDREYYAFSSIAFYTNEPVLLLNGRRNAIEYGSYAPGAPDVFIDDSALAALWHEDGRTYLATFQEERQRLERLLGADNLHAVVAGGGKVLLTNRASLDPP